METLNVALAGVWVEHETERRKPLLDAIAAMPSDVVCLQEVWQQADKDAVIAAAAGQFPHSYFLPTDNDTQVTDKTDANGALPTPPTTAPCASSATKLKAAIDCLVAKCSTIPGSDQGHVSAIDCAKTQCAGPVAGLLTGSVDDKRCYGCWAPQLASETIADIKSTCETRVQATVAFGGQSSQLLLSRHPLSAMEGIVMPATWFRRVVIKATVAHPTKGSLDVYCNHTNPVYAASFLNPYTGQYGAGPATNPWENEHLLQSKRIIDLVKAKSPASRAVVLGDFSASPDIKDGATVISKPDGEAAYKLLAAAFPEAVPVGYAPTCTFCSENPLIPAADKAAYTPEWIDHIFVAGIPASNAQSLVRTFTTSTVAAKDGTGADVMVPLSDHYGLRALISLPLAAAVALASVSFARRGAVMDAFIPPWPCRVRRHGDAAAPQHPSHPRLRANPRRHIAVTQEFENPTS